jgi:1-acyl-sn-glycerol-3-phosphate acyltransferase
MLSDWLSKLWYDIGYCFTLFTFTTLYSYRSEGSRHVPRRGPALIIANHQSFFDPFLVGLAASSRRLNYLARQTLFKGGAFDWIMRSWGAVPIAREGMAKEGIQTVLDLLKHGRAVLLFPEGFRTSDGRIQPLKPGIQLILKRAAVPVVPIGVAGAFEAFPRTRKLPIVAPLLCPAAKGAIAAVVGKPLDGGRLGALPREQALQEMFDAIQKVQMRAERLRRKP